MIDVVAAPKRFGDHQALVFGPFKCGFAGNPFRLRGGLRKQALNVLAQRAAGRRLQIIPIGCQHFVKCVGGGENHFGDQSRVLLEPVPE